MATVMIAVKSSNVRAIGLDAERARILVQFDNGVYECVRADGNAASAVTAFERFLAAESMGKFYNEYIRAVGVWDVRKFDDEAASGVAVAPHAAESPKEIQGDARNVQTMTLNDLAIEGRARTWNGRYRSLILTVGLPRSGKSSWARATGFPVVSPDAIRLALHGRAYEQLAEPFVWAQARLMVRALFLAGHETVILDACSVSRARRDEWRGSEWETFCVVFECSREEARRRVLEGVSENSADSASGALLEAIDRMATNFEPLGEDEQTWTGAPLILKIGNLRVLDDANLFGAGKEGAE